MCTVKDDKNCVNIRDTDLKMSNIPRHIWYLKLFNLSLFLNGKKSGITITGYRTMLH